MKPLKRMQSEVRKRKAFGSSFIYSLSSSGLQNGEVSQRKGKSSQDHTQNRAKHTKHQQKTSRTPEEKVQRKYGSSFPGESAKQHHDKPVL